MAEGEAVCVIAKHDTFGISFEVEPIGGGLEAVKASAGVGALQACCGGQSRGGSGGGGNLGSALLARAETGSAAAGGGGDFGLVAVGAAAAAAAARKTGVPLWDPAWRERYMQMARVNDDVARTAVQNPGDYRSFCEAAVTMAAQPERFDLDVDALDACCRFIC